MPYPQKKTALTALGFVIAITLAFGTYKSIKRLGIGTYAKSRAAQLKMALANFYNDYNAYPIISPYGDHVGIADAELVHALTGTNPIINPDNNVYMTPAPEFLSADEALIDPWGTPYHVHIDTTFNQRITNPQPDSDRPEIPATVLVYSAGPDRDPNTWKDNIISWQ